jgi:hypothetical protein
MFFKFPQEVLGLIYQFDTTYHARFKDALFDIPDQIIHFKKKSKYRKRNYVLAAIRELSTINHIFFNIGTFRVFYDFTTLIFIKPLVSRFIYNNLTISEARDEGIDTRLRYWEWWILLNKHLYISCTYRPDSSIIFEIYNTKNMTTIQHEIDEAIAIELYQQMAIEINKLTFEAKDNFPFLLPNRTALISNTDFYYYI